jgi:acyl-homoserine lactone acylase PvdQ
VVRNSILPKDIANWLLPSFTGSNVFVVHGNHTASGEPILASDPHLDNQMPCMWYQSEIRFTHEGEDNYIIGAQLPGLPFTLSGRHKHLAWGLTILYSDSSDLWEE